MKELFKFDQSFSNKMLIGVDEVGRGPLAGPVVSAAVSFPNGIKLSYLDDSKKLSERKRKIVYKELCEQADFYISAYSAKQIDKINILEATRRTMEAAVDGLQYNNALVLIDGNQKIECHHQQKTIIKGDRKSALIAAASIIAKVYRDDLMGEYDKKYPKYGFSRHKGYASKHHREQIKKYGICPIHRKSFLSNVYKEMNQMNLAL